jgi:hypothetical protein
MSCGGAHRPANDPKRQRASRGPVTPVAEIYGGGFVSILGSKGGQKVESSKNAAGERSYRIAK